MADGRQLTYDKLALCTGASAIQLALPGADLPGVHYLRSLADVESIKQHLDAVTQVVIIGGGYIGLEAAASLRKLGREVRVLEAAERLLQRVTAPQVSAFYQRVHTQAGVVIHTGTVAQAFDGDHGLRQVICADGQRFAADMVIIGVGVKPNTELAVAAGLAVDNGIVVDEYCQTSEPNIVAAGDCASQWNPRFGQRLRLESVPNAMEQAKAAAASICGKQQSQQSLPWFWSDQYDLKLQIAGLNAGHDHVVLRGDHRTGRSFSAFYLRQGELIAADCINRPADFVATKALLNQGCAPDPDYLAAEDRPLKGLLAAA
jgi:3-phenylpropionate/trans-cinnamate dioxygenase ferredoxin reductase subunit